MLRSLSAVAFVVTVAALATTSRADTVSVVSEKTVEEEGATYFVVHSDRLGRNFDLVVQKPAASPFLPGQKFAAVYALDGGYQVVGANALFLSRKDVIAPAVIVSLGYVAGQPNLRNTDLTHNPYTVAGEKGGGGGAAFEAFLTEDLKPFIEARYPADPAGSVLFGHSLGAVFAANVFAHKPDSFAGYILGSFVEPRDPSAVKRVAEAARSATGQRVFLGVGGAEDGTTAEKRDMGKGFRDLSAAFVAGGQRLAFRAKSYPGQNHLSYYPSLTIDGLSFVLPGTVPVDLAYVPLAGSRAARYAGTYTIPDGRKLTVKPYYDDILMAQVSDGKTIYLLPNGTDRYYGFPFDIDVRFTSDAMTLAARGAATLKADRLAEAKP